MLLQHNQAFPSLSSFVSCFVLSDLRIDSSLSCQAYARALRNLHYFERFEGHTIFHEKTSKYGKTKVHSNSLRSLL